MTETLPRMILRQSRRFGSRVALQRKTDGIYRDISWETLQNQIERFGRALLAGGIGPGDRIAIMSPNAPEWVYADQGIMSCGAITIPVYHTEGVGTLLHILQDSGARILFLASSVIAKDLIPHLENQPLLKQVVLFGEPVDHERFVSLDRFLATADKAEPGQLEALREKATPEDIATLVYTSGTTGPPKGAMLTHANLLSNIQSALQLFDIAEKDICLSFLPLSHIFERMAGYYLMLHQGTTIAYAENIDSVPLNLTEVRPTVMISVPRLYEKMFARIMERVLAGPWLKKQLFFSALKVGRKYSECTLAGRPPEFILQLAMAVFSKLVFSKLQERLGGRLRFFVSGGAPLVKNVAEFFFSAGIPIYEGYGLTETSPVITANAPGAVRLGTVGRTIPGNEVKIAPDGEILARGPGIFKGYWQKDDQTREAFEDGWFKTGDIGEVDQAGFLAITDRKKDIIVTASGKKVAPQNLENLFKTDKYLSNSMVYGDRKPFLTALLVPNFDNLEKYAHFKKIEFLTHCDLVNHPRILDLIRRRIDKLQTGLPSYSQVKRFTLISRDFSAEEGEITPTLKLKRKIVTRNFHQVVEGMYVQYGQGIHDAGFCAVTSTTPSNKEG